MEIAFKTVIRIPRSTAQQRRFTSAGNHPTAGMRKAAATWQALFEKFSPARPFGKGVPLQVDITLCFHGKEPLGPKVTRPDIDNLAKMMLDAMTRAGYWEDDNQVASLLVAKCTYANPSDDIIIVRVSEITATVLLEME